MNQHASYSYSTTLTPTTHRYSSTSSAFSASANPNEDWTKISDLAERRRIQNRIAQRNYRKKLKKRLEDLERRAASSASASPEQKPAELHRSSSQQKRVSSPPEAQIDSVDLCSNNSPVISMPPQFLSPQEDQSNFFNQRSPRQISTSPPPFSLTPYSPEIASYGAYSQTPYSSLSSTCADTPMYSGYLPMASVYSSTLPSMPYAVKQEGMFADETNPFNMNFASMAGIDMAATQSYADSNPKVMRPYLGPHAR